MRQEALDKAREDPSGTPARILDAAEDVFAEQGYGAASTREMARRAGVPFGALHYHWGSKKQLWEAVFKRLGERTRETIMRNLRPGTTRRELHLKSVREMFGELARFGIGVIRDTMPDVQIDVPAAIFVIANAFIASLADVDGQEDLLGGSVYTSRPARERLRAELKRFAYRVFNVAD